MAEFSIRSDAVDVEQIMRQIRARIREKRGADYTEQEIRQLANAKLETFLDPTRVRSDLLEQFRAVRSQQPAAPNFAFEDSTMFETHRPLLRFMRRLLRPILKLFFNPNPVAEALHIQAKLNQRNAESLARVETLYYELIHNLVVEVTRLGIEVKNLKMKVESVSGRLDFDERRSRALEGAVQYRPVAVPARPAGEPRDAGERTPSGAGRGTAAPPADRAQPRGPQPQSQPPSQEAGEHRRRRRRRGRRRHAAGQGPGAAGEGAAPAGGPDDAAEASADAGQSDTAGESTGSDEQP
jgi:hypothetical protein